MSMALSLHPSVLLGSCLVLKTCTGGIEQKQMFPVFHFQMQKVWWGSTRRQVGFLPPYWLWFRRIHSYLLRAQVQICRSQGMNQSALPYSSIEILGLYCKVSDWSDIASLQRKLRWRGASFIKLQTGTEFQGFSLPRLWLSHSIGNRQRNISDSEAVCSNCLLMRP